MSRSIDRSKPLSDEDRAYLLGHGEDGLVAQLDEQHGQANDTETGDDAPYEEWSADDLRAELGERKLSKTGNKPELVARLQEDDAASA